MPSCSGPMLSSGYRCPIRRSSGRDSCRRSDRHQSKGDHDTEQRAAPRVSQIAQSGVSVSMRQRSQRRTAASAGRPRERAGADPALQQMERHARSSARRPAAYAGHRSARERRRMLHAMRPLKTAVHARWQAQPCHQARHHFGRALFDLLRRSRRPRPGVEHVAILADDGHSICTRLTSCLPVIVTFTMPPPDSPVTSRFGDLGLRLACSPAAPARFIMLPKFWAMLSSHFPVGRTVAGSVAPNCSCSARTAGSPARAARGIEFLGRPTFEIGRERPGRTVDDSISMRTSSRSRRDSAPPGPRASSCASVRGGHRVRASRRCPGARGMRSWRRAGARGLSARSRPQAAASRLPKGLRWHQARPRVPPARRVR